MSDAPRDTERLDRAIERLTNNQPVPVFKDQELEELLQLARQLHQELPEDMPDPLFREGLREQLLDPRPRLIPANREQKSRRGGAVGVVGGAIAAVLVLAVAVGVVANGQFGGGDGGQRDQQANAEFLGSAQSTLSAVATATATATVGSLVATATRESQPVPTETPAFDVMPPVDSAHVEMGAMTTFEASPPNNVAEVTYTLASSMPAPQQSAPVYRFAVPKVDAMSLLNQVTDALDLDGEMKTRSVRGKTVISFTSTNGTTFTWMPASGAFACNLSGEARVKGNSDEMVQEAYTWLRASGFPLRDPVPQPTVSTMEDGMTKVDFPVEVAPDVAVGHPLTVSVMIDKDGMIKTVSGYWLQLIETSQIAVLSPEEAWAELADGKGFWSSRSPIESSGHFEVETFAVAYVLTVDSDGQLILQPVYRATGEFRDHNGQVIEGVTVMVQAMSDESP